MRSDPVRGEGHGSVTSSKEEALTASRAVGNRRYLGRVLWVRGLSAMRRDYGQAAAGLLEESAIASKFGDAG